MDTHKNALLTPKGREQMVRAVLEGGLSKAAAARRFNSSPKTVAKWVRRFQAEGIDGLRDRSSRPHSSPSQTPASKCEAVANLRRQRHTGQQIAAAVGISKATVSRVLRRLGLTGPSAREPAEPARRYERERPGEMIHIDIKSWAGSTGSVTASPTTGASRATIAASAGNTFTLPSMITRAWPSPKSCPARNGKVRSPS